MPDRYDLRHVTADQVMRAAIDITREAGPSHVNGDELPVDSENGRACVYVCDGRPSCYASRVLHRLGVPVEVLSAGEGDVVDGTAFPVLLPSAVQYPLGVAQMEADAAGPWGLVTSVLRDELDQRGELDAAWRAEVDALVGQLTREAGNA